MRKLARLAMVIIAAIAITGVAATPAQASIVGCKVDNGLTMYFDPDTGNWKSRYARDASGCGEVTLDWYDGWSDTPDDCFYVRARTYRNGSTTFHPWKGPFCYYGLFTVLTGVPKGRQVRIEVKHWDEAQQTRDHVPYMRWYY
jgi:hypothetical protein